MRYSSSKAAVASGGSSRSSYSGGGGGRSSYSGGGSAASAAAPSYSRGASASSSTPAPLHYTKSGALDMRYTTSKAAVSAPSAPSASSSRASTTATAPTIAPPQVSSNSLHYTKSGALDMRYNSSKATVGQKGTAGASGMSANSTSAHHRLRLIFPARRRASWTCATRPARVTRTPHRPVL